MEYPFKFIESKIASRQEFDVTSGKQPTHALFYIKSGSFTLDIDGKKIIIKSGDCVIFPEYIEFSRYVIEPIVFTFIKFRYNEKSKLSMPLPYGKIRFKDRQRFISSINTYDKIIDRSDSMAMLYKKHILFDILLQISNEYGLMENKNDIEFLIDNCHDKDVLKATGYISQNISSKIIISDVCKYVGTNASTLNFKFRKILKNSIGEYIISERIKLAKKLLSGTTYTITDIAERCGYDNIYYFSTAFKKETGDSPQIYRKHFQNII